jgi:hypothetical protein
VPESLGSNRPNPIVAAVALQILRGSGALWFMTAVMRVDPTDEAIAITTIFILCEKPESIQEDLLGVHCAAPRISIDAGLL